MARIGGILRARLATNVMLFTNGKLYPQKTNVRCIATSRLVSSEKEALERVGNIQRDDKLFREIQIEIRAHQPDVLKSYSWFASTAAKELNIQINESFAEPDPYILRKTLLKDVF